MRLEVPLALAGERLDRAVATLCGLSRRQVADAVGAGGVVVDGVVATRRSAPVAGGELLEVTAPRPEDDVPGPDPSVLVAVVHADDHLVVVDKPAGLVVHPGAGRRRGSLVEGLLARYPEIAGVGERSRPGIVHRLDAGTSGLLVVARTPQAHAALVAQLAARTVDRRYRALVWGHPGAERGLVDAPIGRSATHRTRMAVVAHGRAARTHYEVLARFARPRPLALLACRLDTGRTHQIRVHLAAIGHPVVGDDRYGGRRPPVALERPFLHAEGLALDHPATGQPCRWASPLPPELEAALAELEPAGPP